MSDINIKHLLNEFICFDYETVDPYIGMKMGAGWVYTICYPDIAKGRTISVGEWDERKQRLDYIVTDGHCKYKLDLRNSACNILVGQNISYDFGWYLAESCNGKEDTIRTLRENWKKGVILIDTQILSKLVDEHSQDYSLAGLTKKYGVTQKSTHLLANAVYDSGMYQDLKPTKTGKTRVRPKGAKGDKMLLDLAYKNMDKLPANVVKEYCLDDVKGTTELYKILIQKLLEEYIEKDLIALIKHYSDLMYCVIEMRINGMPISIERLKHSQNLMLQPLKDAEDKFLELSYGRNFQVTKAGDLAEYFKLNGFTDEDFMFTEKTKKHSFKKEWFDERLDNEAVKAVIRLKKVQKVVKLLDTFRDIQDELQLSEQKYGFIHGEFKIFGASTGRFSANSPNLQQVSKRDPEFYSICRGPFAVCEQETLCASDYSNQEPRIQVHYGTLTGARGASDICKDWVANPLMNFHVKTAELTGLDKASAKGINLGQAYGMGEVSLCKSLDLPTEMKWVTNYDGSTEYREVAGVEGKNILDQYNEMLPFLKDLTKECKKLMNERGSLRSLGGERIHPSYFYTENPRYKKYTYWKSLNQLIQRSAADQLKTAMVDYYKYVCYNEIYDLQIRGVIHDEIVYTFPTEKKDEYISIMENIMCTAIPLKVPMVVETAVGQSWFEEK